MANICFVRFYLFAIKVKVHVDFFFFHLILYLIYMMVFLILEDLSPLYKFMVSVPVKPGGEV